MNTTPAIPSSLDVEEAVKQLGEAAAAKKCWHCGCLHSSLRAIDDAFPAPGRPSALDTVIQLARLRASQVKYDCLGCEVCFPAIAINALGVEGDACPGEPAQEREGWPPLPGAYTVLRYHAPVAICALTEEPLAKSIAAAAAPEISIVGTMQTENLGIERLIQNMVANPNIRFLVLCGKDSRQAVGHLPGQSLISLARSGVDEGKRIIGAPGKRAILHNLSHEAVEHFRRTVEVVDLVGEAAIPVIVRMAGACAARFSGPAPAFLKTRTIPTIGGYLPQRTVADSAGYFVIFPDQGRRLLTLEHYRNDGVLDSVIEGTNAAEVYTPAIDKGLLSRLDHAAYLGKELARAEHSLRTGEPYVQDAAPESPPPPSAQGFPCASEQCNCH